MQNQKTAGIDKLFNLMPAILAFLVPIFFLPITVEFFEFNKLALILLATSLMAIMWVIKMIMERKVEITKSKMDVPIMLFLGVTIVASIFSLNKVSSIFGGHGRWVPSLFATTIFVTYYYVLTTNVTKKSVVNNTLGAFVIGATIAALVTILSYFGISLGSASYAQIANFTLTGSVTTIAVMAAFATVYSLLASLKADKNISRVLWVQVFIINLLTVLLLKSSAAYAGLFAGVIASLTFIKKKDLVINKTALVGILGTVLGLVLLFVVPATKTMIINENYQAEVTLTAKESWAIASSVIRDFPALGTGPATFDVNYTRYRPISINLQDYWNLKFDKPSSELFNLIASLGLIGLTVVAVAGINIFKTIFNDKGESNMYVTAGLATIVVSLGFTYSTVVSGFLITTLLALNTIKNKLEDKNEAKDVQISLASFNITSEMSLAKESKEIFQYIVAVPIIAIVAVGAMYMYGEYAGEYYMRKAIVAASNNDLFGTYQMQQKAIELNAKRSSYHSTFANTNLLLAGALSSNEDLTDEDKSTIQTLIAQAIRGVRITTETLDPLNSTGWETRAAVYKSLIGVAQDAKDWSVRAYSTAIQLDPTNARLRLDLGGIYYADEDYLAAANLFNQAINLKGDYANAHYNLAQSLIRMENYPLAYKELEVVQRLVPEDSVDYDKVTKELEILGENPAITKDLKPTVAELENAIPQAKEEAVTVETTGEQETLTTVGEDEQETTLDVSQ